MAEIVKSIFLFSIQPIFGLSGHNIKQHCQGCVQTLSINNSTPIQFMNMKSHTKSFIQTNKSLKTIIGVLLCSFTKAVCI